MTFALHLTFTEGAFRFQNSHAICPHNLLDLGAKFHNSVSNVRVARQTAGAPLPYCFSKTMSLLIGRPIGSIPTVVMVSV